MMLNDPHPCIVISSDCEKSLSFEALRDSRFSHMCRAPLCIPHLSFIPPVPYPPLWGTFPSRGRLFLYFAVLRSFDSVLIFSDKPFFNTRRFSPLRMTKFAAPPPLNPLNPLPPLSFPIKGRHAPWANLPPANLRASPRFVILSGEKRRMRDNECQNSCDLSRRISAKPPPEP